MITMKFQMFFPKSTTSLTVPGDEASSASVMRMLKGDPWEARPAQTNQRNCQQISVQADEPTESKVEHPNFRSDFSYRCGTGTGNSLHQTQWYVDLPFEQPPWNSHGRVLHAWRCKIVSRVLACLQAISWIASNLSRTWRFPTILRSIVLLRWRRPRETKGQHCSVCDGDTIWGKVCINSSVRKTEMQLRLHTTGIILEEIL